LLQLPEAEIRRRITIAKFNDAEFVASEVLVSLVRMRYGQGRGLLDRIVHELYGRLMRLIKQYFGKNPQWYGIVSASSEALREATSAAWEVLNKDPNRVSFAEVRFLPWVEARTEDYLQAQLAQKNSMTSYDARATADEDGNAMGPENPLTGDEQDVPERAFERKELSQHLQGLMMSWEPAVRHAVYFRLECDYDWEQVADLMGVSKPTARKYYNIGIERLNGAIND
jgi:DNA-directed RNA polymerase specialized sigma24 family protein